MASLRPMRRRSVGRFLRACGFGQRTCCFINPVVSSNVGLETNCLATRTCARAMGLVLKFDCVIHDPESS